MEYIELELEWAHQTKLSDDEWIKVFSDDSESRKDIIEALATKKEFYLDLLESQLIFIKKENETKVPYAKRQSKYSYIEYLTAQAEKTKQTINSLDFQAEGLKQYGKKRNRKKSGEITEEEKQEARRVPLDLLYGERLRKAGKTLVGRCPFHEEKSGSFTIYVDDNRYHCFGCDIDGDSIAFVEEKHNLKFPDAVRFLLNK